MRARTAEYERRIASPEWKALKQRLISARAARVVSVVAAPTARLICITSPTIASVESTISDLQLLCRPCHEIADRERALRTRFTTLA